MLDFWILLSVVTAVTVSSSFAARSLNKYRASETPLRNKMIFPGTLWCGPGHIARNYSDLGFFRETDMCCRDHDHCDAIAAGNSKYGLFNDTPYTKFVTASAMKCNDMKPGVLMVYR